MSATIFDKLARIFKREPDDHVYVAAAPGFTALHVAAGGALLAVPIVAWAIDREGGASPVAAQGWAEPDDAGRWFALEYPAGTIETKDRYYASRAEFVAAVSAERAAASQLPLPGSTS